MIYLCRGKKKIGSHLKTTIMVVFFMLCTASGGFCFSNEEIADAICKAENSKKFPYGIKSIPTYGNKEYARKICLNTIRNQKIRHGRHNCGLTFLQCLALRYCPPQAHQLNKFWLSNVLYYLNK